MKENEKVSIVCVEYNYFSKVKKNKQNCKKCTKIPYIDNKRSEFFRENLHQ